MPDSLVNEVLQHIAWPEVPDLHRRQHDTVLDDSMRNSVRKVSTFAAVATLDVQWASHGRQTQ